jgi:hypothetical protein
LYNWKNEDWKKKWFIYFYLFIYSLFFFNFLLVWIFIFYFFFFKFLCKFWMHWINDFSPMIIENSISFANFTNQSNMIIWKGDTECFFFIFFFFFFFNLFIILIKKKTFIFSLNIIFSLIFHWASENLLIFNEVQNQKKKKRK